MPRKAPRLISCKGARLITCAGARLLVLALCIAFGATRAAGAGNDYTDQWWNPAEPGWGTTLHQQGDALFVGVMIYAADRTATWLAATAPLQGLDAGGNPVFAGDLFQATGPRFDGAFDGAAVSLRKVGTLTFTADGIDRARLVYSVDGVTVTKEIERQTWRTEDFSGNYQGALVYDINPLHGPCIGGHREEIGPVAVTQASDGTFSLRLQTPTRSCTYSGTYSQAGRTGTVRGDYACTDATRGTFVLDALTRNDNGLTGRLQGADTLCEYVGHLGGAVR